MRTLLIDNYDSFTYNLYQLLGEVNGSEPIVVRNDALTGRSSSRRRFDNVVISPGPGRPERPSATSAISADALRDADLPVLGVCLGHQGIAHVTGGTVDHAPEPMHGRLSPVRHTGATSSPASRRASTSSATTRWPSPRCPRTCGVTAWTADGVVMGVRHRDLPHVGRAVPPRVDPHRARAASCCANFRDLSRSRRRAAARAGRPRRRQRPPPRSPQALGASMVVDPEAAFAALFADATHAFWLDSSHVSRRARRASRSWATATVRSPGTCTYDVAARARDGRRDGETAEHVESVFDYLERELARLRAATPRTLPFDFTGGYVGYLGYELKADCGGAARHRSPRPTPRCSSPTGCSSSTTTQRRVLPASRSPTTSERRRRRRVAGATPNAARGAPAPRARHAGPARRRAVEFAAAATSRDALPRPHRRVPGRDRRPARPTRSA